MDPQRIGRWPRRGVRRGGGGPTQSIRVMRNGVFLVKNDALWVRFLSRVRFWVRFWSAMRFEMRFQTFAIRGWSVLVT